MERNPNFRGPEPAVRRGPVHQVRQPGRGRARAAAGRDRHRSSRSRPRPSSGLGERAQHRHRAQLDRRPTPSSRSTSARRSICPDAEFNPAVQDLRRAPGDRLRDRPRADQRDRHPRDLVRRRTGSCPTFYKSFYETPEQDYPLRPRQREPDPRRRRLGAERRRGPRRRTARSSRSTSTCARSRRTTSRRRSWSPSRRRRSGSSSTSRWSAPTSCTSSRCTRSTASRRRTSTPSSGAGAAIRTTRASCSACFPPSEIGGLLGLLLLEPRVRPAVRGAVGVRSTSRSARRSSSEMVAITQRDLPYIVLTYDPNLQAYRTDTVENVEPACPGRDRRHPLRADRLRAAARRSPPQRAAARATAAVSRRASRSCCSARRSGSAAGCWARARAVAARTSPWSWRSHERPLARRQGRGGAADARSS